MRYRLVRRVEEQFVVEEFDQGQLLPAMEARGFTPSHLNTNHRQRPELQGQPIFGALCGPMWDGDAVRYEDTAANDVLST